MISTLLTLLICCVRIYKRQSFIVIYLCYPLIVYLLTFGWQIDPFLRTVFEESPYINGVPLHSCSTNPTAIRAEIDILKKDFNNRCKQVVFTTMMNAYYASVIPCCFAQKYLFYDSWATTSHMAFVVIGGLTTVTMICFPANYYDVLHRAALHLGSWDRIDDNVNHPWLPWSKALVWPNGSVIKFSGDSYRSNGLATTAIPCNSFHNKFYLFFQNPVTIYIMLLSTQTILMLIQLIMLYFVTEWHNLLALAFLLMMNYYTFYKMVRDYNVINKVYEAEKDIYSVMSAPKTANTSNTPNTPNTPNT